VVSECVRLAGRGVGKGPWVVTSLQESEINQEWERILKECGGQYICIPKTPGKNDMNWSNILKVLAALDIRSIMVEGGGTVINTLLQERYLSLVDSVIITIAPVWLGQGGVLINPPRRTDEEGKPIPVARLDQVKWKQFGDDVVMCGKIKS
jgi:2,5-diamino-6-(ribosylamino)-4(3H)-pyrimidinone 5'-phosphate reductase